MTGLAPHTGKIFDAVSKMESIKPYVLVGGTALSMQIETRQSEDLDFMCWQQYRDQKMEVAWKRIEKELSAFGEVQNVDILDIDHVEFVVSGIKLSFYACAKPAPKTLSPVHIQNNLYVADVATIGMMKMEVMLRRSNFRDYYDIYSILKNGIDLMLLVKGATEYSQHRLKTKNILAMLTNSSRFQVDSNFAHLQPKYDITPQGICEYIQGILVSYNSQ